MNNLNSSFIIDFHHLDKFRWNKTGSKKLGIIKIKWYFKMVDYFLRTRAMRRIYCTTKHSYYRPAGQQCPYTNRKSIDVCMDVCIL